MRGIDESPDRDAASLETINPSDMGGSPDGSGCVGDACVHECGEPCGPGEVCDNGECTCQEGSARPCGEKIGECTYGQEVCQDGQWQDCEGGVRPSDEACDGLDNDCDGRVDEDAFDAFYGDIDGDGWGNADDIVRACTVPDGYVDRAGDCNDFDRDVHPEMPDMCDGIDNDCDGHIDGLALVIDPEFTCLSEGVCAETMPSCVGQDGLTCIYPNEDYQEGEEDRCDGLDNDCDGVVDEGLLLRWYRDDDGDGFGREDAFVDACLIPEQGFVGRGGDCLDDDPLIHPEADEVCDGRDNDCDERIDLLDEQWVAAPPGTCPPALGVCRDLTPVCLGADGWSCPLEIEGFEPAGETLCDALDNDCDGRIDEDIRQACGSDIGVCSTGQSICQAGRFGPCSGQSGIEPTDDESSVGLCDGQDNDCDGETDEGCDCVDGEQVPCGSDVGLCERGVRVCLGGRYGPCDGRGPRAEFCDPAFLDHDCDGRDDIQAGLTTLVYDDLDGDGYGAGLPYHQCGPARVGQSVRDGDCDDGNRTINPDAREICDGVDNDCNQTIDDDPLPANIACNQQGVCLGTQPTCSGLAGWLCEYGGAGYESPEVSCDGLDNDCDGQTDEQLTTTVFTDADADGFGHGPPLQICGEAPPLTAFEAGDCDDEQAAINPTADEVCDGVDNNCVDGIDEGDVCQPPLVQCPELDNGLTGDEIELRGDGSDPDGGEVLFAWQVIEAPPGNEAAIENADTRVGLITPNQPGNYRFELCAIDDEGQETCCQTSIQMEPRCIEPPAAATLASCTVSWDRRPVIGFSPVPPGVQYRLTLDGQAEPLVVVDTPGQNHYRPEAPLGLGGPPPEGQSLTMTVESCLIDDDTCCAPEERLTFQLIETCLEERAPTPDNLVISEYLINGDGGNCPGDGCEAGESIEITNLSHCPVSLDGHHFRYCNNADCTTHRFMEFGPDDVIPPRGVYVTVRNPDASTCGLQFLGENDPALFGLIRSELVVQSNTTDRSGWFVNSGGGSLRVATGPFIDADSGQTIALIDPYRGGQANCQSVGFDALDGCGQVDPGSVPATRLLPDQLGKLWHPCDTIQELSPGGCFDLAP